MASVGVLPIVARRDVDPAGRPPWILQLKSGAVCVAGRKIDVDSNAIGRELDAMSPLELRAVEEAWIDLLHLRGLLTPTPAYPPAGPGGSYPRWSRTYYALQYTQGQQKFHVVLSPDDVNVTAPAVTVVRITTTVRDMEFPEVAAGSHACAGNITSFPMRTIDLNRQLRLRSVGLAGMQRIAAAVAVTHALAPVLGYTEAYLESLLK